MKFYAYASLVWHKKWKLPQERYLAKQIFIGGKAQIVLGVSILSQKTHLQDTKLKLVMDIEKNLELSVMDLVIIISLTQMWKLKLLYLKEIWFKVKSGERISGG